MRNTPDNWDLRAGFTRNYDVATSAVNEADKQFASAQDIVKKAYALDRTAETQESDINRINQTNLESLLVSQEKVGDFQGQQEIARALESLGYGYADDSVSTEGDLPPEQPRPEVMTDDGRMIPDPTAPINAVPNAQKPPSARPAARPMTLMERLKAVEPMLSSPRAKTALRNMVVKESMNEARQLATIAPEEAFNGLIKNGVIRGNPLVANDDGTYTRVMPDGKNQIRIDRNEAAAWVGDMINKTNEQYKLVDSRRNIDEKMAAEIEKDTQKQKNRMAVAQEEARLKSILESQKAGFADNNVRLRARLGAYSRGGGRGGGRGGAGEDEATGNYAPGEVDFNGSGAPVNARPTPAEKLGPAPAGKLGPAPAAQDMVEVDLETLKKELAAAEKTMEDHNKKWADNKQKDDFTKAQQYGNVIRALDAQIKAKSFAVADQGKTMTGKFKALDTLILSKGRSMGEQNKLSAELTRMRNKYEMAQQRGEKIDQAKFQDEYDALLGKIRGGK